MTTRVDQALASLSESIQCLTRLGKPHEASVVASVAVYDERSGEVTEHLYCAGFTDIVAMQIKGLDEHVGRHMQEKCKCGRIDLKPKRGMSSEGKGRTTKVKPPHV